MDQELPQSSSGGGVGGCNFLKKSVTSLLKAQCSPSTRHEMQIYNEGETGILNGLLNPKGIF